MNLFPDTEKEEKVRLGSGKPQIDLTSRIDDSVWVIECKILESRSAKIDIHRIGQAIGQAYALSYLYKNHYQQHLSANILPAVCARDLGSGKSQVLELCQIIGITLVEVLPEFSTERANANLYYLSDSSPRPFCEDWRPSKWIVKSYDPHDVNRNHPVVSTFDWEVEARTHAEWLKEQYGHKQVEVKSIKEGDPV